MRGTLHLLAPEDLRRILNITTARMIQGTAGRHRQLEITGSDVEACRETALGLVDEGRAASRKELFAAFEAAGQATKAQRGIHLLWMLMPERHTGARAAGWQPAEVRCVRPLDHNLPGPGP